MFGVSQYLTDHLYKPFAESGACWYIYHTLHNLKYHIPTHVQSDPERNREPNAEAHLNIGDMCHMADFLRKRAAYMKWVLGSGLTALRSNCEWVF